MASQQHDGDMVHFQRGGPSGPPVVPQGRVDAQGGIDTQAAADTPDKDAEVNRGGGGQQRIQAPGEQFGQGGIGRMQGETKTKTQSGVAPQQSQQPNGKKEQRRLPDTGSPITVGARHLARRLARQWGYSEHGIDRIVFRPAQGGSYEAYWLPFVEERTQDGQLALRPAETPVRFVASEDPQTGLWSLRAEHTRFVGDNQRRASVSMPIPFIRTVQGKPAATDESGKPVYLPTSGAERDSLVNWMVNALSPYLAGARIQEEDVAPPAREVAQQPAQEPQTPQQGAQATQPQVAPQPQVALQPTAQTAGSQAQPQSAPAAGTNTGQSGNMFDEFMRTMMQLMPIVLMMRMMGATGGSSQSQNVPSRYVIL